MQFQLEPDNPKINWATTAGSDGKEPQPVTPFTPSDACAGHCQPRVVSYFDVLISDCVVRLLVRYSQSSICSALFLARIVHQYGITVIAVMRVLCWATCEFVSLHPAVATIESDESNQNEVHGTPMLQGMFHINTKGQQSLLTRYLVLSITMRARIKDLLSDHDITHA